MHKIGIEEGGGVDGLATRIFMWRDACAKVEGSMGKLMDIPTNTLKSIQMASARAMTEARERHYGFG